MSFVKKMAKIVAVDAALKATSKLAKEPKDKLNTQNEDNLLYTNKSIDFDESTEALYVAQDATKNKFNKLNNEFKIYDKNKQLKYTTYKKILSAKYSLSIYDMDKNKVGSITKSLVAVRSPISTEIKPKDFVIEILGEKIGKIKSASLLKKEKFKIGFNNWIIEGNLIGSKYKILNGKKRIANISRKMFELGYSHLVTFTDIQDELVVLMIVLAIIVSNNIDEKEALKDSNHSYY